MMLGLWRVPIDVSCLDRDFGVCLYWICSGRFGAARASGRSLYRRAGDGGAGPLPGAVFRLSWADARRERGAVAARRELPEELGRQVARRTGGQDSEHDAAERTGKAHARAVG